MTQHGNNRFPPGSSDSTGDDYQKAEIDGHVFGFFVRYLLLILIGLLTLDYGMREAQRLTKKIKKGTADCVERDRCATRYRNYIIIMSKFFFVLHDPDVTRLIAYDVMISTVAMGEMASNPV